MRHRRNNEDPPHGHPRQLPVHPPLPSTPVGPNTDRQRRSLIISACLQCARNARSEHAPHNGADESAMRAAWCAPRRRLEAHPGTPGSRPAQEAPAPASARTPRRGVAGALAASAPRGVRVQRLPCVPLGARSVLRSSASGCMACYGSKFERTDAVEAQPCLTGDVHVDSVHAPRLR
ncbi:hypothetical protein HYPSUDRAFT_445044 [Hypholoma sublateritium FD-334 SS-4]|uniref:Uncharacterized protein n=1 Tax=Hypholoma sublateritium (strain FD-334 SS-4) TaxID=945553 RepID=A0A0D2N5L1_HYPSF|nr:hypothetical protein HYPSUDRAFT_445044 [Hypholoma sublateritium FD-334 SS-4]